MPVTDAPLPGAIIFTAEADGAEVGVAVGVIVGVAVAVTVPFLTVIGMLVAAVVMSELL